MGKGHNPGGNSQVKQYQPWQIVVNANDESRRQEDTACRKQGKYVGICGQGPSDHPDLAEWLVQQGISSVSLNPDTVISTWLRLADQGK